MLVVALLSDPLILFPEFLPLKREGLLQQLALIHELDLLLVLDHLCVPLLLSLLL